MSTVGKIEERTVFISSDGKFHDSMDEACDHQERVDFQEWCYLNICRGGEWSASMVADAILDSWRVQPKE